MNLRATLFLVLAAAAAHADLDPSLAQGSLAVLDFKSTLSNQVLSQEDVRYFADSARGAALKTLPGLHVMTRENLLVLLQANGKDLAACEGECEVETGRRIGADLIISGELLKIGTSFKLNLRLHETHKGQMLSGEIASGKTVDELDAKTAEAVERLLKPLAQGGGALVAPANAPPKLIAPAAAAPLITPANPPASPSAAASAPPAAEPAAPPADPGSTVNRHLGFLFHVDVGGGYLSASENGVSISGVAGSFGLELGYAVWENNLFALHVYDAVAVNPSVSSSSSGVSGARTPLRNTAAGDVSLTTLGIGASYTHYFMPLNLYFSGTLAVSTLSSSDGTNTISSGAGYGLQLALGKEWWVSDHWGIGAAAQFSYAGNSDTNGASIGTSVFKLALSATWN